MSSVSVVQAAIGLNNVDALSQANVLSGHVEITRLSTKDRFAEGIFQFTVDEGKDYNRNPVPGYSISEETVSAIIKK